MVDLSEERGALLTGEARKIVTAIIIAHDILADVQTQCRLTWVIRERAGPVSPSRGVR